MRKNQTSMTAMGIAVLRAVESEKPAGERICFDPYARRFIPGWMFWMTRFFITSGYAEMRGRGVLGFLAARERYIDDYLERCLAGGFDQLVVLGAGYDARAYRFTGLRVGEGKPTVRVFEVDHPATQQEKLKYLVKIFGQVPQDVEYVSIDFNRQSLAECLSAHGYRVDLKSVFIWQGVTYYLDPVAVDNTLALIAGRSAPGSSVIFDYMDSSLLQRPIGHGEIKGMKTYRGMTGEELKFGIPVDSLPNFLRQRGFTNVVNTRSEELKALYFSGKNRSRNVMSGYAIASAEVQKPA